MTLAWALLLIAVIYFSIISPGFRKFAIAGTIVIVVGGIALISVLRPKARERQAEQQQPQQASAPAQESSEQEERNNYLSQLPKDEDVIYQTTFSPAEFSTWKGHTFILVRSSNMLTDLTRVNRFHESWASEQHVRFRCKPSGTCQRET